MVISTLLQRHLLGLAMSSGPPYRLPHSLPVADSLPVSHPATAALEEPNAHTGPANLSAFAVDSAHHGLSGTTVSHRMTEASVFSDFAFPYQQLPEAPHMIGLGDHGSDLFTAPGGGGSSSNGGGGASITSSLGDGKDSVVSGSAHRASYPMAGRVERRQSRDASEDRSPEGTHAGANSLEDDLSDDFGLSSTAHDGGTDLGGKLKDNKNETAPAWSELKTKAGKERKRLPLACIACRRKKIRCSGEKPACKHCLRSRIPCVYKVTTRKAAPRTDYMTMLDRRLKRMEDRIIKIVPKSEQDASAANVTRANLKPAIYNAPAAAAKQTKKRGADEAFGADLDHWARTSNRTKLDESKPASLQVQEREDSKLLNEGRDALPPMAIREHLAEVFFENIYGQAYHLLHKPSYMRKLKWVVVAGRLVSSPRARWLTRV